MGASTVLTPGWTIELVVPAQADTGVAQTTDVTNWAYTSADSVSQKSASEMTTIEVVADLSVSKEDMPDPVLAGNSLVYTLMVTNAGPDMASDVTLVDTLPAGVTYASDTDSCVESPAGVLTCDLGDSRPVTRFPSPSRSMWTPICAA